MPNSNKTRQMKEPWNADRILFSTFDPSANATFDPSANDPSAKAQLKEGVIRKSVSLCSLSLILPVLIFLLVCSANPQMGHIV